MTTYEVRKTIGGKAIATGFATKRAAGSYAASLGLRTWFIVKAPVK